MKILHIISQRPDSTGSGIYLQEILKNAQNLGHSNFIICGLPHGEPNIPDLIDKDLCEFIHFETDELPFPIVGMSDIMPYPSTKFLDLTSNQLDQYIQKFKTVIRRTIDNFKPDIIHSHHLWLVSSLIPDLAPDIPVVTNCHGSDIRQFKNLPSLGKRVQTGCAKLDHIFALSNAQRDDIARLFKIEKTKISIVGGGFNSELFNTDNRSHSSGCLRMLYVGKLSYAKGVPYLLKALTKLKQTNYQLTIVGDGTGSEKEDCLSLAHGNKQVTIMQPVFQQEIAALLQKTDLFILPSLFEGMPLVVLEALACGCMVLASQLPGVTEIIDRTKTDKVNLITLPENHSPNRLTHDHQLAFINNIYKQLNRIVQQSSAPPTSNNHTVDYFNWKNVFDRIQTVYRKLHNPQ